MPVGNMMLRLYDPQIGRFLQVDPYNQFASGYLGMGNDPVNGIDPSGGWVSSAAAAIAQVGCPGVSGLASIGYSAVSTISSLASSFFTVANIAVRMVNDGDILNSFYWKDQFSNGGLLESELDNYDNVNCAECEKLKERKRELEIKLKKLDEAAISKKKYVEVTKDLTTNGAIASIALEYIDCI